MAPERRRRYFTMVSGPITSVGSQVDRIGT